MCCYLRISEEQISKDLVVDASYISDWNNKIYQFHSWYLITFCSLQLSIMCPHFSEPSYWVVSSRDLISKCGKIGKRSTYPILSQATYTIIERNHQSINTLWESTLQNWAEKRKVDRKKQNQGHDMLICHSKLGESFEWKDDHGDTASNITHNTGRDNWAVRSTDLEHEVTESETNAQRRVICVCCLLYTRQKVYSINFKGFDVNIIIRIIITGIDEWLQCLVRILLSSSK